MRRVAQHRADTLTYDFSGEGTTITGPTIRVVNDEGVELVPTTAATPVAGDTYSYVLTPEHTNILDSLTVTWGATIDGITQTITEIVEVVGAHYFSLAEFGAVSLGGSATIGDRYSEDRMREVRAAAEDAIEHACRFAFVPRYSRLRFSGNGTTSLLLPPYTRAVRWVTVGGSTAASVLLSYDGGNVLTNPSRWTAGWGNIVAGVEHGMDGPSPRVKAAALLLAKTWIVSGPVDDRVTTMSSPDTGITAALAVPGRGGSTVGVPEVDAVINEYRFPAVA